MYLKSASDFMLHRGDCNDPSDPEDCACRIRDPYNHYLLEDRRTFFKKGTPVCIVSIENDVASVLGPGGQIGKVANFTYFTKLWWRFNTVVIRHIKNWNGEDVFVAMILLAVAIALGVGAFCLIKTASASGKIDECYIKQDEAKNNGIDGPVYSLRAHRSWRSDEILYSTKSYDDAVIKMKENCPR